MKRRYSQDWYCPSCHIGRRGPWYIAIFERWATMRKMNVLRAVGCRTFSDVPANTIVELAIEYTGSQSAGWKLADWYFAP